jgi:hypothetical protein
MASQPRLDALVAYDLGVLVTAPCEGAHEDPGLQDLTGLALGDERAHTEVDLSHFAHGKLQLDRRFRCLGNLVIQKAIQRMHAAAIAMLLMQRPSYGCGIDSLGVPLQNLLPKWLDTRNVLWCLAWGLEERRERGVLWNLTQWIQPILRERNAMDRLHRRPAYVLGPRNLASGFAHSQTLNDLPYFEHLEPPVSHRVPPGKIFQGNAIKKSKTAKASQHWPYLAATPVALSGRKSGGSIWPQLKWLYVPANSQSPRKGRESGRPESQAHMARILIEPNI